MRLLTQDEKSTLILLTTATLAAIAITLYFSINIEKRNKHILSSKIHIIHTGGEIETKFKENYSKNLNKYDISSYEPLMNSSNIVPKDWNIIAEDIGRKYQNYDAFIIVCGRDTLAYTASALSFMLENLSKPVVLTDGEVNSAVKLTSTTKIPEVMVASGGKLLRGCRVVYNSTDYFTSPNYPPLNQVNSLSPPEEHPHIKFVNPNINVVVIKVFPGINAKYLINNADVHGIVLEMYGTGNGPISQNFLDAISVLAKKGIVIVAVSQNNQVIGSEIDIRILEAGVLAGYDMTTTAAYAKICFLLGNVKDKKLIGQLMEKSFRGEMTVNYPTV
jgi:L-asparaginase/Glu-tRNA(Gln) amidotransferase subunit D